MAKDDRETLDKIYDAFGKELTKLCKSTVGEMVMEYLPYAETDLAMNAYSCAYEILGDWLAGKSDSKFIVTGNGYRAQEIRELMYKQHKDEIIKVIGKDKDREIERLKMRLEESRRW